MPKQILRINDLSGGLNNALDPRDIADNQVTKAKNVKLDKRGKVSILGSEELHESDTGINDDEIGVPGEGLIFFKNDFNGAGHNGNILSQHGHANWNEGFDPPNWTKDGDFTITNIAAEYVHSSGTGYVEQLSNRFGSGNPIANHQYLFKYELTDLNNAQINNFTDFYISATATDPTRSGFPAIRVDLPKTNGYNQVLFLSNTTQSNIDNSSFKIVVASSGTLSFKIRKVEMEAARSTSSESSDSNGGEYLLFRPYQTWLADKIWEKNDDGWSYLDAYPWGNRDGSLNKKSGLAHYYVDGTLRLSDTELADPARSPLYLKYAKDTWRGYYQDYTWDKWEARKARTATPALFWIPEGQTMAASNSVTISHDDLDAAGNPFSDRWHHLETYTGNNQWEQSGSLMNKQDIHEFNLFQEDESWDQCLVKPGEGFDAAQLAQANLRNVYSVTIQWEARNSYVDPNTMSLYPLSWTFDGPIGEPNSPPSAEHATEQMAEYSNVDNAANTYGCPPSWVVFGVGKASGDTQEFHLVNDNATEGGNGIPIYQGGTGTDNSQCSADFGNIVWKGVEFPDGLWNDFHQYFTETITIDPACPNSNGRGDISLWKLNENGQENNANNFEDSWDGGDEEDGEGHEHAEYANDFVAVFGTCTSKNYDHHVSRYFQGLVQSVTISDTSTAPNYDDYFGRKGNGQTIGDNETHYDGARAVVLVTTWTTSAHASGWQGPGGGYWWSFGVSALYEGGGESKITSHRNYQDTANETGNLGHYHFKPNIGGAGEECPTVQVNILDPHYADYDSRHIGFRIYAKNHGVEAASDDWFLQYTINFRSNTIKSEFNGTTKEGQSSNDTLSEAILNYKYITYQIDENDNLSPATGRTYREVSGIGEEEESIHAQFKTAIVLNRRAWIANIKTRNRVNSVYDKRFPDAMIGSKVNAFDFFPSEKVDEVSIMDGDEIVKLEAYHDKMLQFKKKKLHILDMSDPELIVVETTELHKGIEYRTNACSTEFGVAWINNHACYLYDGEKTVDLTQKEGVQLIKIVSDGNDDSWEDFTMGSELIKSNLEHCGVGYDLRNRQLVITGFATYTTEETRPTRSTKPTGLYIYDFVTGAWTTGENIITEGNKTNIVNDGNGDLVWVVDPTDASPTSVKKWSPNKASTNHFVLKTKDYDFNDSGVKKKIYSVELSYKGDASALNVKYAVNGETDFDDMYQFKNPDTGSGDDTPLANKSDLESWHTVKLVPSTLSQANNIYSFAIEFNGTAGADFEINDMHIVYRKKNIV